MNLHQITIKQHLVDQLGEHYGSKKFVGLKGTRLLIRLADLRVVSQTSNFLTDKELEIAQNAIKTAEQGANTCSDGRLDYLWAKKAIQSELAVIGSLHGDNPHRPDSEFWKCLIRIASVIKGSGRQHFSPSRVRTAVLTYAPNSLKTKGNREKDLEYLFGRAMNQAHPRYRIKGVK